MIRVLLLLLVAAPAYAAPVTQLRNDTLRVTVPVPVRIVRDTIRVTRTDTLAVWPDLAPQAPARQSFTDWFIPALIGGAFASAIWAIGCRHRGHAALSASVNVNDCDGPPHGRKHRDD